MLNMIPLEVVKENKSIRRFVKSLIKSMNKWFTYLPNSNYYQIILEHINYNIIRFKECKFGLIVKSQIIMNHKSLDFVVILIVKANRNYYVFIV